jgi:hypothetical protein
MQNIDKIDLKLNAGTKQKLLDFVTMIQSFQVINENQDAFFLTDHVSKIRTVRIKKKTLHRKEWLRFRI